MKGRPLTYSERELAWIKRHCTRPRREAHALFCTTFRRTDVTLDNFKHLCARHGWVTGRSGCFPKGHTPDNKGKRMPFNANTATTQFKKGHLPHNTKYLGHERVSVEGYVEISIAKTYPHTGFWRRYVLKHKYLWERQHGAVPAGHYLKSKDGNRLNTDPDNWILLPRSVQPFLNGHRGPNYDQAAPEVRPAILTLAKLKRARFTKTKERMS
jgi:HNH endonuclease